MRSASSPHVVRATRIGRAASVRRAGVSLLLVERRLRVGLARYAAKLTMVPLEIDVTVSATDAVATLTPLLAKAGCPEGAAREAWIADMARLARAMGALQDDGDRVRLRVERVTDDSCRLFHVDYVRLRLITTYAGSGTQWVENSDVVREMLGKPGASPDAVNARVVRHHAAVRQVPAGVIVVMKGEKYPGNKGNGLVHRSAPIEGSGETRVRFVVDTACC